MTPLAWHPHLDVWGLVLVLGGGYLAALRWWHPASVPPGEPAASRGQITSFFLGLAALWVAADWPVHDVAETRLLSVHMMQHLLMTLVAPPLLLMGTPDWLFRRLTRPRAIFRTVRFFSRPLTAILLFNAVLAVSHWPAIVDLALRHHPAHLLLHAVLVLTALAMWMPVLSPVMEIPRLSYPVQMLYLFAQSIVPTVPASFLTFGSSPLYRFYAEAPRMGLDVITDQRIAGLLMKLLGGMILWIVIGVLFFKWHAQEESGVDALAWRDVDRALDRQAARP